MPNVLCRCRKIIPLGEIPCANQWMIIADTDITEKDWESNSLRMEELYKRMKIMVKCPECKRLYIYWNGFDKEPEVYGGEQ